MKQVTNATVVPFSSVCHLEVTRKKSIFLTTVNNSTGWLLGRNAVGTAAHNVHSWRLSKVTRGVVRTGRSGDEWVWTPSEPFGRADIDTGHGYPQGVGADYPRDYAMVHLEDDSPYASAFRLPAASEANVIAGTTIHVAGFPGEGEDTGITMFHATAPLAAVDSLFLYYDVATEQGVSGGPVWIDIAGDLVVVGVHVGGGQFKGTDYAMARRLDAAVTSEMQAWMDG